MRSRTMAGAFCSDAAHVDTCTQWPAGSRWKAPRNGVEMSSSRHTRIAATAGRLRNLLIIPQLARRRTGFLKIVVALLDETEGSEDFDVVVLEVDGHP